MHTLKLGLIREGKVPPDKRVPFSPAQVEEIKQRFPNINVVCQESATRCFSDDEYRALDIEIVKDISDCDILMGIKEVPMDHLIPNKTYLFFSHTIKKQPYNRKLLRTILEKNIRLIDYEGLKDTQGNRLVAFGRYAGIVGAYNGLLTYGKRYNLFTLRRAYDCFDINDLKLELRKVNLPPIKIILTGAGRVGKGAMETLDTAGIRKVSAIDFLNKVYDEPVYAQLSSADYHESKSGGHFNREEFHQHPEKYSSSFTRYTQVAQLLLGGAYWNPAAPVLFTREDMLNPQFKLKVIADITCDINGSIPSTKRSSTITDPVYDYNPIADEISPPFSHENYITTMAVDNLPCELPRSASEEFGRDLIDRILKPLLTKDTGGIIKRGTVCVDGELTKEFKYLQDYVSGK